MLGGGALSLVEAESRPPVEMSSGVLTELFPVSGVLGGVVPFTSSPGDRGALGSDPNSALDSGVPFVVGFESRIGEIGDLDCGVGEVGLSSGTGETALGSGVLGPGVGLTAGFCSGVPILAGVGSGVGETAGLASGVMAGFASGVGVTAFGGSGVGLGIGLASGAGLVGFGSGITGCLGSGDGVKVGFVSGGGEMVIFGSGVAAGLGSGVGVTAGLGSGVTGGLGSGEGGGGAVDLTTGVGLRSEADAGFGGEGVVFGSGIWLGTALISGAAEELKTSESAMAAVHHHWIRTSTKTQICAIGFEA